MLQSSAGGCHPSFHSSYLFLLRKMGSLDSCVLLSALPEFLLQFWDPCSFVKLEQSPNIYLGVSHKADSPLKLKLLYHSLNSCILGAQNSVWHTTDPQ